MTTLNLSRFASRAALDAALEDRLAHAIAAGSPSAIMLSGGTTPLPAYRALARRALPHQEGLRVLFSDDRYVPADSPVSNYYQSRPLIDALSLAAVQGLRVRTELPLAEAAADYQRQLEALLAAGAAIGLGLLGLGADGHTASLFTASDLERARGRLALAVQRPDGLSGVSVTPEFLARVSQVVFVVAGSGKPEALGRLIAKDATLTAWAAVQGCAGVELWMDDAAAPGA